MRHLFFIVSMPLFLIALCASTGTGYPDAGNKKPGMYCNPVIRHNCPDPSVIDNRSRDGYFYVYSTQDGKSGSDTVKYLPVYRSKNLVDWEACGSVFGPERPRWEPDSRIWAPDINYFGGRYVLYYALGVWGHGDLSASGVAVSDSPTGPFKDIGMIVDPKITGIYNSIDPDFFEDGGVKYLFWGSLGHNSGIWGARLAPDGLSLAKDSVPVKLAGDDMEGTYVHKHGKYYYLFASEGFCCNKESSSYRIVVGRSLNPLGPYSGESGMSMISEKGDYDGVIMNKCPDLSFVGPGHDSEIITDDKGDDWMLYHVYWKGNGYNGRLLAMDRVLWGKDGWPYFAGEHPSSTSVAPVFR